MKVGFIADVILDGISFKLVYLINWQPRVRLKFSVDLELEYLAALPAQGVVHKKLFLSLNYPSVDGSSPNLDLGHQIELCVLWEVLGVSLKFRNYFMHYAWGIMSHHTAVHECGNTNTPCRRTLTHTSAYSHVNACINFYTCKWSHFHTNGGFSCTYADTHCPLYTSGREWNSKAKSPCHICRSSPIQWHWLRCPRMHLASEQLTCPPAYLPPSRAPR